MGPDRGNDERILLDGAGPDTGEIEVERRMLEEGGDYLEDEALACERLRAERRVVVPGDDQAPVVSRSTEGMTYVVTGAGKFLASDDDGKNFSIPSDMRVGATLAAPVRAMGTLTDGSILVVRGERGALTITSSEDRGYNWRNVARMKLEDYDGIEVAAGADIVQLKDGAILIPVLCGREEGGNQREAVVVSSTDGGKTWKRVATLGRGCAGANVLELSTGELLAAITFQQEAPETAAELGLERIELLNNVVLARSQDGGRTWSDYRCVTRYGEAPGNLIELGDGTVVLTYGQQNFPFGARAMASKDGGRTWSDRVYILGFSTACVQRRSGAMIATGPGWNVSSAALENSVILTVYNRGSLEVTAADGTTKVEVGRAALAVRWTLDGMDKPPVGFPGVLAKPNADGYLDNGRCLIKPEHMNKGGDYLYKDEILVYERIPAEHVTIGPSAKGPIIARDPQGRLVAACFFGEVCRSADEGRNWELISTAKLSDPIQAFGVLADGTMLAQFMKDGSLVRSEDGGKTWGEPIHIDPAPFHRMGGGNCMRINQLPHGTVLMTCGNLNVDGIPLDWDGIYRSRDAGKTWGDFSVIGARCCESNVLRLRSGRMLVATRTQGSRMTDDFIADPGGPRGATFIKNVSLAVSDDDGYTWSSPWTVTRFFECPGDLVEMQDGAIVLSYQQKTGASGSRAMVSRDQGKTWDPRFYILGWWPNSLGHTSSVLLKDGSIITVTTDGPNGHATIWEPLPLSRPAFPR